MDDKVGGIPRGVVKCIEGVMEELLLYPGTELDRSFICSGMRDLLSLRMVEIYRLDLMPGYMEMGMWEDGDDPSPSSREILKDLGFLTIIADKDCGHLNAVTMSGMRVANAIKKSNYIGLRLTISFNEPTLFDRAMRNAILGRRKSKVQEYIFNCPIATAISEEFGQQSILSPDDDTLLSIHEWLCKDVIESVKG